MDRELRPSDFHRYFQLRRYSKRHGPFDIIHSHSTKAGFLTRLLPRRFGASFYTPHGLMTQNVGLRGLRRAAVCLLESLLARRCDGVIAVSEMERRCALDTGIPANKLATVPNGLSSAHTPARTRRSDVRTRLKIDEGTVCIGSVGLLVPNKEHARLLDAFAIVQQKASRPVALLIIGWGVLDAELRVRAAQVGLSESVRFLGQVPAQEYFPAFDILAHPSRYEGFAYTFLEALSVGIPIVTTRVGGASETVEHSVNGFLCDPWDTEAFAGYLLRLIEDVSERYRMGASALQRAQNFTASSMVESTLQIYQRVRQIVPDSATQAALISRAPQ
jgi:glycosyltransferase involved in cell wall biosynthesis